MRILFMGTPDFACETLKALSQTEHTVCGVVSQPDKPKGRHGILTPPPVKELALSLGYEVFQPSTLKNGELLPVLEKTKPDIAVVAAYGKILPEYVLNYPEYGCINVHASLLPKYRGASPINSCIIHGEKETGVTIMHMEKGLDTGDMIDSVSTPVYEDDNAETLHDRLALLGAQLLVKVLKDIESGCAKRIKQDDSLSTYAPLITRQTCIIDFSKSAPDVFNFIRGLSPYPGAYTVIGEKEIKIFACEKLEGDYGDPGRIYSCDAKNGIIISCGGGAVRVLSLQTPGKKRMYAQQFLAGNRFEKGSYVSEVK